MSSGPREMWDRDKEEALREWVDGVKAVTPTEWDVLLQDVYAVIRAFENDSLGSLSRTIQNMNVTQQRIRGIIRAKTEESASSRHQK